jgi:hypothetical protein
MTERAPLIDDLVEIAMSVCHHDADDDAPASIHERDQLRKRFAARIGRGVREPEPERKWQPPDYLDQVG